MVLKLAGTMRAAVLAVGLLALVYAAESSFIQTCQNCLMDHVTCDNQCHSVFNTSQLYECGDMQSHQLDNSSLAVYDTVPDVCTLCNCSRIQYGTGYTSFRTASNDGCLWYTLFRKPGYTGISAALNQIDVNSEEECLELCLDTSDCRGVTYWPASGPQTCNLHNNSDVTFAAGISATFIRRECVEADPLRLFWQTCHNCRPSIYCPSQYRVVMDAAVDHDCDVLACNITDHCRAVQYSRGECLAYTCGRVSQDMNSKVFRMATSSFCPDFEIFTYVGYEGVCGVNWTSEVPANDVDECLERCLDMDDCQGTTFLQPNQTCIYHEQCTGHTPMAGATFIRRECFDGSRCEATHVQTCLNCRPDFYCPGPLYILPSLFPKDVNTNDLLTNPDTQSIWYYYDVGYFFHYQCRRMREQSGYYLHRSACSPDCPVFEIFELINHAGTCDVIATLDGGVTLEYCVERCLDMDGCMGTTFHYSEGRCTFHNCDSYSYIDDSSVIFVRRKCVEEEEEATVIQTCLNCEIGPNCQADFEWISDLVGAQCPDAALTNPGLIDPPCNPAYVNPSGQFFQETCLNIILKEDRSDVVVYKRTDSSCLAYQCSQVQMSFGNVAHRRTNRQDCQMYEMFTIPEATGTCDVIGEDEGSYRMTFAFCVEKCLDMPGCMAVTFYTYYRQSTIHVCHYHGCADYTPFAWNYMYKYSGPSMRRFMRLECVDTECNRQYKQHCLDCRAGPDCQRAYFRRRLATREACYEAMGAVGLGVPDMLTYDAKTGECGMVNCSQVTQDMFSEAFRWSCTEECPTYYLYTLDHTKGNCTVLDLDEGGVTLQYCTKRCLDMPGCKAVTHDHLALRCQYHDCADSITNSSWPYTFVSRVCVTETYPVKPFTQTCINCQNLGCEVPVQNQTGIYVAHVCNTTCTGCDVMYYDTQTDSCLQYQCDSPWLQGPGTTMVRKSTDPDCPKYELLMVENVIPDCWPPILSLDGVSDVTYCLRQCLDTTGCLSVRQDGQYCSLYTCDTYKGNTEKSSKPVMIIRRCIPECTPSTTQTCLNCQPGPECQSPYTAINVTTNVCDVTCDADQSLCEGYWYGVSYDITQDSLCHLYQCNEVQFDLGAVFQRKTCNAECPIYELYYVDYARGTCPVIGVEYFVLYPWLCMQKCLDTAGCRSVSYDRNTYSCIYHSCDCYKENTVNGNLTFMWIYCLDDLSMAANVSTVTAFRSVCEPPPPLYIMPCQCSTGTFENWTMEEIVTGIKMNLTIDPITTSAFRRTKISASDSRTSSQVVGTLGAILFSVVLGFIVFLDSAELYGIIRQMFRCLSNVILDLRIYGQTWAQQADTDVDADIDDLTHNYM